MILGVIDDVWRTVTNFINFNSEWKKTIQNVYKKIEQKLKWLEENI